MKIPSAKLRPNSQLAKVLSREPVEHSSYNDAKRAFGLGAATVNSVRVALVSGASHPYESLMTFESNTGPRRVATSFLSVGTFRDYTRTALKSQQGLSGDLTLLVADRFSHARSIIWCLQGKPAIDALSKIHESTRMPWKELRANVKGKSFWRIPEKSSLKEALDATGYEVQFESVVNLLTKVGLSLENLKLCSEDDLVGLVEEDKLVERLKMKLFARSYLADWMKPHNNFSVADFEFEDMLWSDGCLCLKGMIGTRPGQINLEKIASTGIEAVLSELALDHGVDDGITVGQVEQLDLSHCDLGDEDVQPLLGLIELLPQVSFVDLSNNHIYGLDESAEVLLKIIQRLAGRQDQENRPFVLDISGNPMVSTDQVDFFCNGQFVGDNGTLIERVIFLRESHVVPMHWKVLFSNCTKQADVVQTVKKAHLEFYGVQVTSP